MEVYGHSEPRRWENRRSTVKRSARRAARVTRPRGSVRRNATEYPSRPPHMEGSPT